MKNLQKLDDFRALSKDNLIEEMMTDTIKGGCCIPTTWEDNHGNSGTDRIIIEHEDQNELLV